MEYWGGTDLLWEQRRVAGNKIGAGQSDRNIEGWRLFIMACLPRNGLYICRSALLDLDELEGIVQDEFLRYISQENYEPLAMFLMLCSVRRM